MFQGFHYCELDHYIKSKLIQYKEDNFNGSIFKYNEYYIYFSLFKKHIFHVILCLLIQLFTNSILELTMNITTAATVIIGVDFMVYLVEVSIPVPQQE